MEKRKNRTKRAVAELEKLSPKGKKNFLSMDLIERMIRIEQTVSCSHGKDLIYDKTRVYKNLSSKNRKKFEDYLKKHKRRKFLFIFYIFFSLSLLFFLQMGITGNAIGNTIGSEVINGVSIIVLGLFLLMTIVATIVLNKKHKRMKRFDKNFKILENVYLNRYF